MLRLLDNRFLGRAADATAEYKVAILDGDGSTVYSTSVIPEKYSVNGMSGIWTYVLEGKAEERKQALRRLKDDSLSVRCDVTVKSLEKEGRVKYVLPSTISRLDLLKLIMYLCVALHCGFLARSLLDQIRCFIFWLDTPLICQDCDHYTFIIQ